MSFDRTTSTHCSVVPLLSKRNSLKAAYVDPKRMGVFNCSTRGTIEKMLLIRVLLMKECVAQTLPSRIVIVPVLYAGVLAFGKTTEGKGIGHVKDVSLCTIATDSAESEPTVKVHERFKP